MNTKQQDEESEAAGVYDASAFDRPSVTVDVVALTAREDRLHALLIRRGAWPFAGSWALPGGFVRMDEDLDQAAQRELCEETGVGAAAPFLEQLYTFGAPARDPRTRVISVAYYALLPGAGGAGFPACEPQAGTDAAEARWWPVDALPPLAFDHDAILQTALTRLRAKLGYTSVAYALLPAQFTLSELQKVYETILARPLDKRNFRKKMLAAGILEPTGRQKREGAHRPAELFRFTRREAVFLDGR
jgi:8-oxo-dGTP diphosphatase